MFILLALCEPEALHCVQLSIYNEPRCALGF